MCLRADSGIPGGVDASGYDDRSSLPIGLSPTLNYVVYAVYAHYAAGRLRVEYQQRIAAGELSMIKKTFEGPQYTRDGDVSRCFVIAMIVLDCEFVRHVRGHSPIQRPFAVYFNKFPLAC